MKEFERLTLTFAVPLYPDTFEIQIKTPIQKMSLSLTLSLLPLHFPTSTSTSTCLALFQGRYWPMRLNLGSTFSPCYFSNPVRAPAASPFSLLFLLHRLCSQRLLHSFSASYKLTTILRRRIYMQLRCLFVPLSFVHAQHLEYFHSQNC